MVEWEQRLVLWGPWPLCPCLPTSSLCLHSWACPSLLYTQD